MEVEALRRLLGEITAARLLVVGDVMLDRFIHGEVVRVSAEAPIPILTRGRESSGAGGAANVARNVVALGGQAALAGLIGADGPGEEIGRLSRHAGVDAALVIDATRPTTVKVRFAASGQQLLRFDTELVAPAGSEAEAALISTIRSVASTVGAILISDYGKGAVTPAVVGACLAAARDHGAVVVVDSKARGFAQYGPVDLVKPNAAELSAATDLPTLTDAEVECALAKALAGCEAEAILVTRAAQGMSLAKRGAPVLHAARAPAEVFDTVGAGDTALAALGAALAAGADLPAAMALALLACSRVVQKADAATVTPDELLEAELAAHRSPLDAKIATAARMAEEARRWRERGLKVGFTNGCFDILHAGHIAYLAQARGWCDRLIVGLNTDESVRAAKGPGRPVNGLEARARVLAALAAVDLVAPFAEETPIELIKAARPDLLIKGADYRLEEVVGRELVEGWGGEVRLADLVGGQSTSGVIRRLSSART
jgi:D-beta-D-heptose 7-phosphate kinase/D-beta-D-heptose 1-phosphate adenosyltransferase